MPVPLSKAPTKNWSASLREDTGAGLRESVVAGNLTVAQGPGTYDNYTMVPEDGYLHSVEISFINGLTVSDTNYFTLSLINLGQDGLGMVEMLAMVPENTSKATGGSPINPNARRIVKLSTTLDNLKIQAGDRLRFRFTETGTLPNSLGGGIVLFRFNP